MWLFIVILFFMKGIFCVLKYWFFFSTNYLSREKFSLGTAKIQSTTNGFLKEFKLAFNVAKTMITSIALNISFFKLEIDIEMN